MGYWLPCSHGLHELNHQRAKPTMRHHRKQTFHGRGGDDQADQDREDGGRMTEAELQKGVGEAFGANGPAIIAAYRQDWPHATAFEPVS